MAQAGNLQFGVDESFLSQSVSRALINGTKMAQRSNAFTPGINEQAFRQPLGRITGDVAKFQSSLAAANQRVIAFGASASVFYGISTALRGLVTSTIQVNKSMIEINSIFGLSQKNLSSFKNELFDVARKTSQSFSVVAESAKEFSRQGLSVAETLKRVRDSMILTRMTGLSAADAANTLTAAINSFNKSGLDSTEILNKMVAADTNFAVSSKDLADALTRVGSSAQDAGVQFEELLALVTSVKQITGREGSVIANGFKSIFNREQRSTTLEQLEKLGVAVRDQNSNILPTIQVLKNLAKEYDTLGVSQKQQVAQMMGGVYQMNTLKAVMSDLSKENSIYNQALKEIGKSQDEAIKRNEYLNTSFSSMIERAQATFGQIGANLGEKIFTSNTGSIKQAINSLFGRENFEGFVKGLEGIDTEGIGNTLGSGLIKGLGNTFGVTNGVPGPGLLAIGLGITKVLTTSIGMAVKDMGSMLGIGQKVNLIHTGIERAILGANEAEKMRLASAKSVAAQEAVILDILIRQNAAMAAMKAERSALQVSVVSNNPTLAKEAIKMSKWVPPTAASGLLPAIAQESHLISKGIGGATPSAKPVVIPNFNFGGGQRGPVVANTDEYLVPNYKGAGSAIFNRQMVASQGLPSGAVRVAASGLTPINIENQFGRLFGELSRGGQFNINGITTSQKGMGYSNKLYAELVGLLGEKGARSIFGKLVPQEAFNNPNIKAVLPQLSRGKFGRSNLLRMFGEDDQFGPAINFRGGSDFDNDLGNNASRILRMMQQGYGATEFTTFLANGYTPNFARRGRPSIKGRQIRYEGDMDFSSVLGPEGLMQLFTIFGFGLGNHPTKSTIDRRALEKFGISIPEGLTPGSKFPYRGAAGGLVPKSLSNAISREIKAGAPLSSIYLDKDSRLISRDNPMGLLVANRRDEPAGGFEGVNRYQNMGLNPKIAGSHIPNFADPSEMLYKYFEKFQLSGGNAASILGPKALPSLGNAEKLIGQQIAKVIKNVDLKSIDFTSTNFTSQITKKVKDSIKTSFKGIDFGRTSAFSKITDQIIQDREREIKSLIKYQNAVKLSTIESEKRAKFESFVSSQIRGYKTQTISPNELIRNSANFQTTQNIEWSGSKLATQINKQTSIQSETLAAIKRQAAANTIQSKLSSGKMFGDLTGLEQITLRKQFQQQAYQQLGFASSGASLMSVMRNKEARGQISDYVNQQIALISQKEQIPQLSSWQKWKARAGSPMGQMAMMMAPSMLSGFIPEGEGGTKTGMALGAAQTGLVGMGTGAMFGPIGALVGAGIGGFMGIASKWNKSFDEISREIEKVNEKNQKVINDIQMYINQAGQVTELISEGTSPKRIKELLDKQVKLFSTFTDPSIRRDIMTGDPEKIGSALNRATEYANKRRTGLDLVSSVTREDEEVGITRKLPKNSWALNFALPGLGFGVGLWDKILAKTTGSGIYNRLGIGEISSKGKEAISTQLVDSLRDFSENDIKKFSEAIQNDGLKSLENFKDQLNLTSGEIEYIRQKSTDIEFKDIAKNAIEQRVKQLNIESSFGEQFRRGATRFQLSNLDWQRAGFAEQLKGIRVGISGESAIRKSSAIRTAGIELNPSLTEASRTGLLGEEQIANIQSSNRLKMFGAIQNAKVALTGLPQQSGGVISTEEIIKMKNILDDISKTGDISSLEAQLKQLEESQNNLLESAKDANSDDKQFQGLFLSSFRDQYKQLVELTETAKAELEEAKITNAINQVRAKEAQRQNLLNSSNYSVDVFSQLRRNSEAARGLPFARSPYKEGLTVQAKINEQDYLTSLGIANSDESLAELTGMKAARAKAMMATMLSQETGQKISPYDTEAIKSAAQKSRNASRYNETLSALDFNYSAELKKLSGGGGSSAEIVDKLMKSGGDAMQATIATNTGNIASTSSEINTNVIDGFSRIENLWSMVLTENASFGKYKNAMTEKSSVYTQLENSKDERLKLIEKGESTSSIDITIKDLEAKLKIADEKVNKILNEKTIVSSSPIGGMAQNSPASSVTIPEGDMIKLPDFVVTGESQKDAVDSVTESLKGLKQGLVDANTEWGTFAQLGEETGKRLSSAAGEGFGAFVTGSMNSTAAFRNFSASVIAEIAKMYAAEAMKGMISSLFSFGSMAGGAASGGIATSGASTGAMSTNIMSTANTGGSILKFATGGKVPALLTGGEFYFSPSAARSIGQNNLNAINSGTARFAGGGLVRGGSGYMDDVPAMLDNGGFVVKRSAVQKYGSNNLAAMARNLGGEVRMYASGGNVSPAMGVGGSSSGSGGNTNVKIELHDNRTSASASSDNSVNDPEFNKRLSIAIKSTVLQTVNEQRRIGGSLRQSQNY